MKRVVLALAALGILSVNFCNGGPCIIPKCINR